MPLDRHFIKAKQTVLAAFDYNNRQNKTIWLAICNEKGIDNQNSC